MASTATAADRDAIVRVAETYVAGFNELDAARFREAFSEAFDRRKYGWEGAPLHDPCVIAWLLRPELFSGLVDKRDRGNFAGRFRSTERVTDESLELEDGQHRMFP